MQGGATQDNISSAIDPSVTYQAQKLAVAETEILCSLGCPVKIRSILDC
jgi:hypothetical protein